MHAGLAAIEEVSGKREPVSVFDLQTLAFNSRDDVLECLPMVTESGICDGQQFWEARLDHQVPLDSQRQPPERGGISNGHGATKVNTDVDSADVLN